jgi:endonuclease YncB( thermonuclease family)
MLGSIPLTILAIFGLVAFVPTLAQEPAMPTDPVPAITPASTPLIEATVTRVIDGSSLDAHIDGKRVAVGYLGVDVPQLNAPCGQEAFIRNKELAGSKVLLQEDATYQMDEIGRKLYNVFTEDGRSIEEALVREGLARAARTDALYGTALADLEATAKAANEGCIWSWAPGP